MKEINIENWNRKNIYNWFKTFKDSTYSVNVTMDVTNLVNFVKENDESFFINMLFILMKSLNSVEEMRTRIINDKIIIYDDIDPAFTVMTKCEVFDNATFKNTNDYQEFKRRAKEVLEKAKNQDHIEENEYNKNDDFAAYYITCLPWIHFNSVTHPIPEELNSQCVPRICFSKYIKNNNKYEITVNINVSHLLVDGYHISKVFNILQDNLNSVKKICQ